MKSKFTFGQLICYIASTSNIEDVFDYTFDVDWSIIGFNVHNCMFENRDFSSTQHAMKSKFTFGQLICVLLHLQAKLDMLLTTHSMWIGLLSD